MSQFGHTELRAALRDAGIVDSHYHVGPELLPRRYDVKTLAEAAAPWRASLVLKNHTYPTTPLAALARAHFGARFYGGVVLNGFVGGLNPHAVESAVSGNREHVNENYADTSPIVVWMPTVHAVSHLKNLGHAFDPRWSGCCMHHHEADEEKGKGEAAEMGGNEPVAVFDDRLRPLPALINTLEAVAKYGCILATGHLSAPEVLKLVPLALDMGVRRIIVTHPDYPSVGLSPDELRQLTRYPQVFIEHCFAIHTIEEVPLARFADSIRTTGPEQVLLSTDFGQITSDPFPDGTIRYANELWRLLKSTVSRDHFLGMFSANGQRALGVSAEPEPQLAEGVL